MSDSDVANDNGPDPVPPHLRKNIYLCNACGRGHVSQDMHEGVTPFAVACDTPGCQGHATSLFYACPQPLLERITPAVQWYRPEPQELSRLSPLMREHVSRGGLVSRRVALNPAVRPARSGMDRSGSPGHDPSSGA